MCVLEYMSKYLLVLDAKQVQTFQFTAKLCFKTLLVLYIIMVHQQHVCSWLQNKIKAEC